MKLGDKFTFTPSANLDNSAGFHGILRRMVVGTVVEIHDEHRWFRVAFTAGELTPTVFYECFKF